LEFLLKYRTDMGKLWSALIWDQKRKAESALRLGFAASVLAAVLLLSVSLSGYTV